MAMFSTNTHRTDPYKNFKFGVKLEGSNDFVAGLSKCSGLKKTTELIEWRTAGDNSIIRKLTGRTNYQPVTLEMGLTHDDVFEAWANLVNSHADTLYGDQGSSKTFRKEVTIELRNEQGAAVMQYILHRAWVSEFQAMPDLDANGKAVAITSIKIEYEGFSRSGAEPGET